MPSIYAVFDTNILVSALIKYYSVPGLVVSCISDNMIIPIIHKNIIKEYNDVLHRKKFKFEVTIAENLIQEIIQNAIYTSPLPYPFPLADEKHRIFLETTLSAKKQFQNAYLITGNKKHFPTEPFIINATEALEIIKKII